MFVGAAWLVAEPLPRKRDPRPTVGATDGRFGGFPTASRSSVARPISPVVRTDGGPSAAHEAASVGCGCSAGVIACTCPGGPESIRQVEQINQGPWWLLMARAARLEGLLVLVGRLRCTPTAATERR